MLLFILELSPSTKLEVHTEDLICFLAIIAFLFSLGFFIGYFSSLLLGAL